MHLFFRGSFLTIFLLTSGLCVLHAASAREVNPVVRDADAMAAGLYASAALDGAPIDIFLFTARGAQKDVVYLAIVPPRTSPSAFRGHRDIVPFAIARTCVDATTAADIDGIIRHRVVADMGRKANVRDAKKDPRVRKAVAEIAACANAITHANRSGIAALSAAIARLPEWPWGFPQGEAKDTFHRAVFDRFQAQPPVLPAAKDRTAPSWCRSHP